MLKQILANKGSKVLENFPGMDLEKDDSSSLVYQSDDTEDYCNLEQLKKGLSLRHYLLDLLIGSEGAGLPSC